MSVFDTLPTEPGLRFRVAVVEVVNDRMRCSVCDGRLPLGLVCRLHVLLLKNEWIAAACERCAAMLAVVR